jgi:hypothetical protein
MRYSRQRICLFAALGTAALVGLRCIEGPLTPIAPSMTVELNLPLYDDTKLFADLVTDTLVHKNLDGSITYSSIQSLKPIPLDSSLSVQPQSSSQQVGLGAFAVGPIPTTNYQLNAAAIFGGLPTAGLPIPPFPATSISAINADYSSEIGYVHVQTGTLSLTITNTLPVPILLSTIVLKNDSSSPVDTAIIGTFSFAGALMPNVPQTATTNLATKSIRGKIKTDPLVFSTPGSGVTPVTVQATDGLSCQFTSTTLQADTATAKVPAQAILSYADSSFVVDDSIVVRSADFKSGGVIFAFINNTSVRVKMYVKLNEVVKIATGLPLIVDTTLLAKDSVIVPVTLTSYRILTTPQPLGTTAHFSVGISTITSDSNKVVVTSSDFVRAQIRAGARVALKSVTGKIKPVQVAVNTSVKGTFNTGDFAKNFSGQFTFDSTRIRLRLGITGGFPMDYHLTLVAKNTSKGVVDSIVLPASTLGMNRVYPGGANPTEIVVDKNAGLDAFLGKFFPSLPDSFFVRGTLTVEPADVFTNDPTTYMVADTSKVYPSMVIDFPARFGIANGYFRNVGKIAKDNNSDLIPKEVRKSLQSAALNVQVTNGLPLQLGFRMNFVGYDSAAHVRDTLFSVIPTSPILPAPGDSVTGFATGSRVSSFSIGITNADLTKINAADSMAVQVNVSTPGNGTIPYRFRSTDPVRIRVSGHVVYTVNKK